MITLLAKVWYDLWRNKSRTIQVVLIIALGSIAIGLVIGGRNLIAGSVLAGWREAEPAHIRLRVAPPLSKDQIDRIQSIDGVDQAEGLFSAAVEWRLQGDQVWQTGTLNGRDDYQAQQMGLDGLVSGQWPQRNTLGVGQLSVGQGGVFQGDTVELRFGDTIRLLPVVGTLDPVGPTPVFEDTFYADGRTFLRITGIDRYNIVQTRDVSFDPDATQATDLRILEFFEDNGIDSVGTLFPFQERIQPPDVVPAEAILNALFLLLGILGIIVVILGIFLVYNSISAIVAQQVDQIGVMKAIGARERQVIWSYLLLVMAYSLLATLISLPLGAAAAGGMQLFFARFLNLEIFEVSIDSTAIVAQISISAFAPLIAASIPLRSGTRITVREAIGNYGLSSDINLLDRLVARMRSIPYSLLLSVGNTFRNRQRVIIIQIALVIAGAVFMMVIGLSDSTTFTFGSKLAQIHNYQITLTTTEMARERELVMLGSSVEDVDQLEAWLVQPATARPISQAENEVFDARLITIAHAPETTLYQPDLQDGRWLSKDDRNSVVVSSQIAEDRGWSVGDWITLQNNLNRELQAKIVGIHDDPASSTTVHLPLKTVQRVWRQTGLANTLWLQTSSANPDQHLKTLAEVELTLARNGIKTAPSSTFGENTIDEIQRVSGQGLAIILNLLAVMAIVVALIGGVGLSGILSLSVLERRREIGVMRAIGASSWQIIRLFINEGLLLGWLSWLIALPLSVPMAYLLATRGLSFTLNQRLSYQFTPTGALIWFVLISLLAIIASALPARGAARISVRQSLMYQ